MEYSRKDDVSHQHGLQEWKTIHLSNTKDFLIKNIYFIFNYVCVHEHEHFLPSAFQSKAGTESLEDSDRDTGLHVGGKDLCSCKSRWRMVSAEVVVVAMGAAAVTTAKRQMHSPARCEGEQA